MRQLLNTEDWKVDQEEVIFRANILHVEIGVWKWVAWVSYETGICSDVWYELQINTCFKANVRQLEKWVAWCLCSAVTVWAIKKALMRIIPSLQISDLGGGDCFDLGQMKKRCVQRYCFETRNWRQEGFIHLYCLNYVVVHRHCVENLKWAGLITYCKNILNLQRS